MKKIITLSLIMLFFSTMLYSQEKYQLSSHILDVTKGQPAPNVKITLSKADPQGNWIFVDEKLTDKNGRITDFLKETPSANNKGIYKLTYYTAPYFQNLNQESFYPFIEVVFELKDENHYHVPITLSPYGYSTYRGN
ncbi:hydroxyisourate hydrolase [Kaistella sp. 97-N-M2]|uniref:hydroxyisourate hydrolase n=1 Tax=Kaistella sp. 97-N-M2 TaxID=2908645 RepID=UPI001F158F2E|nr:hydroxyisourate hydrolase [Kaistella sp. 97-N-M2]UJF29550.1 hydroxyisourate hydrolase [Kaistella sp. 97-N-M2]